MMKRSCIFLALYGCLWVQAEEPVRPLESYAKEDVHVFLLAGQSNMAGRGEVAEQDLVMHPRVFALSREGEWEPAVDPIHYDKKSAGVGPGKTFALTLLEKNPEMVIALVPAACGGSPISTWEPGGYHDQTKSHPYDDAIARTQRALEDGVLKSILWHQGESDSKPELAAVYKEKLSAVFQRFRDELDAATVPILIGQLGKFDDSPWDNARKMVNRAHLEIAQEGEHVVFVSSDGLTALPDNVHFDAKSQRAFGRRYAEAYLEASGND